RALLLLAHASERARAAQERGEQTAERDEVVALREHARANREAGLLQDRRLVVVLALVVGGVIDRLPEREAEREQRDDTDGEQRHRRARHLAGLRIDAVLHTDDR